MDQAEHVRNTGKGRGPVADIGTIKDVTGAQSATGVSTPAQTSNRLVSPTDHIAPTSGTGK